MKRTGRITSSRELMLYDVLMFPDAPEAWNRVSEYRVLSVEPNRTIISLVGLKNEAHEYLLSDADLDTLGAVLKDF